MKYIVEQSHKEHGLLARSKSLDRERAIQMCQEGRKNANPGVIIRIFEEPLPHQRGREVTEELVDHDG